MDFGGLYQLAADNIKPYRRTRWTVFAALGLYFFCRIVKKDSHWLAAYVLCIYLIQCFILFATPKDSSIPDPFEAEEELQEYVAPTEENSHRPFIRNLPEYNFWTTVIQYLLIAHAVICFDFTNLPVYIPILVLYFVFMVIATVVKLWEHSSKYKYDFLLWKKQIIKD
ncbi:hypothetical protein ENBRE01_2607 [Enteropsectra breve]|nr:hypothetical protein ENBRE01_2607 [Enteropsectra breve]